jgi:hypothetical protein
MDCESLRRARANGWPHPVASLALAARGDVVAETTDLVARRLLGITNAWAGSCGKRLEADLKRIQPVLRWRAGWSSNRQ